MVPPALHAGRQPHRAGEHRPRQRRSCTASATRAARARSARSPTRYGLDVDPDALVEELGVGDRQRVEILKVLYRGAKILILDEPTAVLVPQEVDELFANLRELKSEGLTVIFISHKLDEVLKVADDDHRHPARHDRRHGRPARRHRPAARRADGRQRAARARDRASPPSPTTPELAVEDASPARLGRRAGPAHGHRLRPPRGRGRRHRRRRGQRPGRAGRGHHGPAPADAGRILLGGEDITAWSTARRREAGIGFIPEDRHRQGLLLEAPLWENRMLGHQTRRPPPGRAPVIDRGRRAQRDTERDHRASTTCAPPAIDVTAGVAVGRQPAEAHHRPRDGGDPERAGRRPPHPRRGRRRAGRDLGAHPGRPARAGWPCCSSRPTSRS